MGYEQDLEVTGLRRHSAPASTQVRDGCEPPPVVVVVNETSRPRRVSSLGRLSHLPAPGGAPACRTHDFAGPPSSAPQYSVIELGDPQSPGADELNDVLCCFDSALRPMADGPQAEFSEETKRMADMLQSYVTSGVPPVQPALRRLVEAAQVGQPTPDAPAARRDLLLRFMATPSWGEWSRAWATQLGLMNLRELPLSFATKLVQSSLAAGLQNAFLKAPAAGGVLGTVALVLPLVRQAWALYEHRQDATARAQVGRLLQISGLCTVLLLTTCVGGWQMLSLTGAASLSYTVGAACANLLRNMFPMTAGQSGKIEVQALAFQSAGNAATGWAAQLAQKAAAPQCGTSAFSRDASTGAVEGRYHFWQQAVEALLEAGTKELVKTSSGALLQQRVDAGGQTDASGKYRSRRWHPQVEFGPVALPAVREVRDAFVGTKGNNPARQATSVGKGALGAFLANCAQRQGWSPPLAKLLVPAVTVAYETFMNAAGTVAQERREADLEAGEGGLNYDIAAAGVRRNALIRA